MEPQRKALMRVLLLAPQPFYQERGTPIAVDLVLRVLSERGDSVDALTYAEGKDVVLPGVRLYRIADIPWTRGVPAGLSFKKVVCDTVFFFKALSLAVAAKYDIVHAVEESVFTARIIRWLTGTPYLYDMDSSMPEQIVEKFPALRIGLPLLRAWEAWCIRQAEVVIPVCDSLAEIAKSRGAKQTRVLSDVSLLGAAQSDVSAADVRRALQVNGSPTAMYVGNLERYQGIGLLLESFAIASRRMPQAKLIIVGGPAPAVGNYQRKAQALGIAARVLFTGPRPLHELGAYLQAADVLVSPRLLGGNTPMKIYSYLDSGTAVLATDLPAHRQIMTQEVALLVAPNPKSIAQGLVELLADEQKRRKLAAAARELIQKRHTYAAFQATLLSVYDALALRSRTSVPSQTAQGACHG